MNITEYAAMGIGAVGGLSAFLASRKTNTAQVWKEEAEAQKSRADRLENDLNEIKERLTSIEKDNRRLIELLTAIDPSRIR